MQNGALILPASQHINPDLPAGIFYPVAASWHICTSRQVSNYQQPLHMSYMSDKLWAYAGTSVE